MQIRLQHTAELSQTLEVGQVLPANCRWAEIAMATLQQELGEIQKHCPELLTLFEKQHGSIVIARDRATYHSLLGKESPSIAIARRKHRDDRIERDVVICGENYMPNSIQNTLAHELGHQADDTEIKIPARGLGEKTIAMLNEGALSKESNLFKLCSKIDLSLHANTQDCSESGKSMKRTMVLGYDSRDWNEEIFATAIGHYAKNPDALGTPLLKQYVKEIALPYIAAKAAGNRPLFDSIRSHLSRHHYGTIAGTDLRDTFAAWIEKSDDGGVARDAAKATLCSQRGQIERRVMDFIGREMEQCRLEGRGKQ